MPVSALVATVFFEQQKIGFSRCLFMGREKFSRKSFKVKLFRENLRLKSFGHYLPDNFAESGRIFNFSTFSDNCQIIQQVAVIF